MKRIWWVPLFALLGCGQGGPSYMLLKEGKEWSYQVKSSFHDNVVTMKVGKPISVGGLRGYSLESELGESRFAWDGRVLVASKLANTIFVPPIPILAEDKIPDKKNARENEFVPAIPWKGRITSFGKSRAASGNLSQRRSILQTVTGDVSVVETVVKLDIGAIPMELRTWFERGKGIVKQEQRTNRKWLVGLELLRSN
jgi:hypothetical protein